VALLASVLLVACGNDIGRGAPGVVALDTGESGPDGTTDVGVDDVLDVGTPDGSFDGCAGVCFEWVEEGPAPEEPGPESEPPEPRCNQWGLDAGVCPSGFECRAAETTWLLPGLPAEPARCEGGPGPYALGFDLASARPKADISLLFRLPDGTWRQGAPGSAGRVVFEDAQTGRRVFHDVPTTPSGRLAVSLPSGLHDVTFTPGTDHDIRQYPIVPARGRLEVVGPGTAAVPVRAGTVDWTVRYMGHEAGVWPEGASASDIEVSGAGGGARTLRTPDAPLAGTWTLWPGRYDVSVTSAFDSSDPPVPSGTAQLRDAFDAREAERSEAELVVRAHDVEGRVVADDVPVDGARVVFRAEGGEWEVRTEEDGRFSTRLLDTAYEVWVDTSEARGTLPEGRIRLMDAYRPPGPVPLGFETVRVAGEVRVEGEVPPEGLGATLDLVARDKDVRFDIAERGRASFAGVAFAGEYDVWVTGPERALPELPGRIAGAWNANSTFASFDVDVVTLDLEVTVDGGSFQDVGAAPGELLIYAVTTNGWPWSPHPEIMLGQGTVLSWSLGDATSVSARLTRGDYAVVYRSLGAPPFGISALGTLIVPDDLSTTVDVSTTRLDVSILRGGALLSAAGGHAGVVAVGGDARELSGNGPSVADFWLVRGTFDVAYRCSRADGCAVEDVPTEILLLDGVAF
jgi:hypothetical protein